MLCREALLLLLLNGVLRSAIGPTSCCLLSPCVTWLSFSAISRSQPGVLTRLEYGVVLPGVITPRAA